MECRWPRKIKLRSSRSQGGEDVGVSSVLDGHDANTVKSTAGSAELDIVSIPVENLGATEDCKVLEFSLSDGGAVVSNNHKLAGSVSKLLLGELVTNLVLAGFDGQVKLLLEVLCNVIFLSHVDNT